MSRLDQAMTVALQAGRTPSSSGFGGLSALLAEVEVVAQSPFAAEFVTLVMDEADAVDGAAPEFVTGVIERLQNDFAISSIVDILADRPPLPPIFEQRCFRAWLRLASSREAAVSVRTAALRGALLMKRGSQRRALELAGRVAASDLDDDPHYLAHAARIGGLLHSEAPNGGIVEFLEALRDIDGAADEAAFELGLHEIAAAFNGSGTDEIRGHFDAARSWFEISSAKRESRSDAKVLSLAIGVLSDFHDDRPVASSERLDELSREAFAYSAYAGYQADFLQGLKAAQVAAWASLSFRLHTVVESLAQPGWLDAAQVIESELLTVYTASRTIFRKGSDGGVERIVRPRIEQEISKNRSQLFVLREWLKTKGMTELGPAAAGLLERAEAALIGDVTPDPKMAATVSPTVAAILGSGDLDYEAQQRIVQEVVAASASLEQRQISPPMAEALHRIEQAFQEVPEFRSNPEVRALVLSVVWKTLLFLEGRLDPTIGVDPTVKYLFLLPNQPDPLEKELQADFMRFMRTAKFGTVDEWRGIGGGRADVVHQLNGIRFVTEVKRELEDASFPNLLRSYGDQTALYQTTNIPVGILLVLDLTTRDGKPDHFKQLYKPIVGNLLNDGTTRGVLVVKIPARKITPSGATEKAKKLKTGKGATTKQNRSGSTRKGSKAAPR
ncbi:hypothetical protein [Microvirga thermotolerans]|uniref:Uncharacterized protein n=1 Tax=Microvirga thermotolerans TaxID=2651334 RepID=A0A5P9JQ11_9HYPH|nr:hypothetical protein [Microvirga thermotolerans]QFU14727.1 hypothetical protein GDR74_00040 [Microvirga thermotolerans]